MNEEIFEKYRRTGNTWYNKQSFKLSAMRRAGSDKRFCICGTIACKNTWYSHHKSIDIWVPKKEVSLPGFFEKEFPYVRSTHKGSKETGPTLEEVRFALSQFNSDKDIMLDLFISTEYQKRLLVRRPESYKHVWQHNFSDEDYMRAMMEFARISFDKNNIMYKKLMKKLVLKKFKGK